MRSRRLCRTYLALSKSDGSAAVVAAVQGLARHEVTVRTRFHHGCKEKGVHYYSLNRPLAFFVSATSMSDGTMKSYTATSGDCTCADSVNKRGGGGAGSTGCSLWGCSSVFVCHHLLSASPCSSGGLSCRVLVLLWYLGGSCYCRSCVASGAGTEHVHVLSPRNSSRHCSSSDQIRKTRTGFRW